MKMASLLFSVGARRQLTGHLRRVTALYAVCFAAWAIWAATVAIIDPLAHAAIFVCFMLGLMFLAVAPGPGGRQSAPYVVDCVLSAASIACGIYFIVSAETIASRISLLDPLTGVDFFFGTVLWLLAVEATRRAVGLALMIIVLAFVVYNLLGHLLDGVMSHGVISYEHFLDQSIFTTNGVFGAPVQVAATYAFLFVCFGVFLQRAGGSDFFFNLAAATTGRSPGGPAKVAIVSSALYGTMSGSPTSDVVTTGAITIPMMRRLGYSPPMAGAIEVAASTGGSILPPVMGSAVFILVELTGISYRTVVVAAIVPALLFYFALYVQVHLSALRLGLRGLSEDGLLSVREALRDGGVFVIPLLIIVGALILGYTPTYAAVFGVLAAIVVSLPRAKTRIGVRGIYEGLSDTTSRMVPVTAACAAAGLVVGGISLTGLAGKFSYIVFALSGENRVMTLGVAGALCIFLGMGMPTPSAYILSAVLVADVLIAMNIEPLSAHMFLLFFSVLSAMTPPVAVAAYAASSIADANPLAVACTAVRLSLVLFILPFAFVSGPGLIAQASPGEVTLAIGMAIPGVFALAVASEGYLGGALSWWQRVAAATAGFCLLFPAVIGGMVGELI
jgi:TRAP transporter 4TM/12TM fusion protein